MAGYTVISRRKDCTVDSERVRQEFPANPSVAIDHLSRVIEQHELPPEHRSILFQAIGVLVEVEDQV